MQSLTALQKIELFRQFTDFADSELEVIMPYFEFRKIKKKSILLDIGEVSNEVFYVCLLYTSRCV